MGSTQSKYPKLVAGANAGQEPSPTSTDPGGTQPVVIVNSVKNSHELPSDGRVADISQEDCSHQREPEVNGHPRSPDSAVAGLGLPIFKSSNNGPSSPSETISGSPSKAPESFGQLQSRRSSAGSRRYSDQSSTQASRYSISYGQHPITKKQVFRRFVVEDNEVFQILCPLLVNKLFLSPDSHSNNTSLYSELQMLVTSHSNGSGSGSGEVKRVVSEVQTHAEYLGQFVDFNAQLPKLELGLECLYPPGSTVFSADDGGWRAYRVGHVRVTLNSTYVHAYYLGFGEGGKGLVPRLEQLTISRYTTARPINALGVIPGWYMRGKETDPTKKLVERGSKSWEFNGKPVVREYDGDAWPRTDKSSLRVIVDYTTSSRHKRLTEPRQSSTRVCPRCLYDALEFPSLPDRAEEFIGHDVEICANNGLAGARSPSDSADEGARMLDEDALMFLPSMVWAFSLVHKEWKMVPVDSLHEFTYRTTAWEDSLQMDRAQKNTLDSAAKYFFDVKTATGNKSLVVLLNGATGMGKTYTVECLAEKYEVPLYSLSLAPLSINSEGLDERLREARERARNWRGILLLDDAEFFMRKHNINKERHVALASVFHQALVRAAGGGVLVVVASRCEKLRPDKEVESLMNLRLTLKNLAFPSQQAIWRQAILALELDTNTQRDLIGFVNDGELRGHKGGQFMDLNGWEIQSCMRAAVAIAQRDSNGMVCLDKADITGILDLGKEFEESFKGRTAGQNRPEPEVVLHH